MSQDITAVFQNLLNVTPDRPAPIFYLIQIYFYMVTFSCVLGFSSLPCTFHGFCDVIFFSHSSISHVNVSTVCLPPTPFPPLHNNNNNKIYYIGQKQRAHPPDDVLLTLTFLKRKLSHGVNICTKTC